MMVTIYQQWQRSAVIVCVDQEGCVQVVPGNFLIRRIFKVGIGDN